MDPNHINPAFPQKYENERDGSLIEYFGLSKREYFAAQSLSGLCHKSNFPDWIAERAVQLADALIEELEKND